MVVAIKTNELRDIFTEKHNISSGEFNRHFAKLKERNKVFTVTEIKKELMQWND